MSIPELQRFAQLALDGIDREYPYHLLHLFPEAGVVQSPRSVTPVFWGCFDWHSAVHGHWLLARSMDLLAGTEFAQQCRSALDRSLTFEGLEVEQQYVTARPGFERPYGLAWVLTLACELQLQDDEDARRWRESLRPLEHTAADHLRQWLPKLTHPNRTGTHNQTSFSMVLALDWARVMGDEHMLSLLDERGRAFFGSDHDYPLHLEPSGEDFLSASLGAAWLMSRLLDPSEFELWLDRTMPGLGRDAALGPVSPRDRSDGRLCHLDGLNLSRAWMLRDIAARLEADDVRLRPLEASAGEHQTAGLVGVSGEYYAGSHWLGTFAAYLLHRRMVSSAGEIG
ncbi:MAG: DUF2891 domain-containing protein [Phycisphaerales bacterium]|nr:DUF2891 domain-containing protein [Phycisphaerales bacterium]